MTDEVETKAAPVAPSFVDDRTKTIPLEWPVEYDGEIYTDVTVRRMTGAEVSAFFAQPEETRRLPMFNCPAEVIDALDADDAAAVSKAVMDFLPRSMRPAGG
jgi:hypothetical protein